MENIEKKTLLEIVKISYKNGFLDGLNYEERQVGEEVTTREEFESVSHPMNQVIEEAVQKIIKDENL